MAKKAASKSAAPAKKPTARPAPAKPPAAKPDPIVARSARELGPLVGRTHTTVNNWLKRDDWKFGKGPWKASDIARIQQWAAAELVDRPSLADLATPTNAAANAEDGIAGLSIPKRADVALKMMRKKVLEWGLGVQQGKYHNVEDCQRNRLRAILEVKQALLDLADSFPGSIEDKSILRGRVLELLRRFASGMGVSQAGLTTPAATDVAANAHS